MVWIALAGALLSLDRRAVVQAMLAHPVVAATIVGALLGDLPTGLGVGVLFGLIWSGSLPVGGVIPPDETLGAIVGAAVAILGSRVAGLSVPASAMTGFLIAIPVALLGRGLELGLRRWNGELARRVERDVRAGDLRAVDRATFAALGVAFTGSLVLQLALLAALVPLTRLAVHHAPASTGAWLSRAAFPVPIAGLGGVVSGAGFRLGLAWASLGFAVGLLVLAGTHA